MKELAILQTFKPSLNFPAKYQGSRWRQNILPNLEAVKAQHDSYLFPVFVLLVAELDEFELVVI